MWQYETIRPFRGVHVRTGPLLRHRLYNFADIDFNRISSGAIDRAGHDLCLLEGVRAVESLEPDLLDVYKLERIHLQGLSQRSIFWCLSGHLNVILPYLWVEMTDASLRIPWRHKRTRSLVLEFVAESAPALRSIPTDTGAPFRKLTPASAREYAAYLLRYGAGVFKDHYAPKWARRKAGGATSSIPEERVRLNASLSTAGTPYDAEALLASVEAKGGQSLSRAEAAEVQVLLHCRLLRQSYPNIRLDLDFRGPAGDWAGRGRELLPGLAERPKR